MPNFSYYIKKGKLYIPFISYTKEGQDDERLTYYLSNYWAKSRMKSRWSILNHCGKKFTANEDTPDEIEATPNDIVVFHKTVSWRTVGLLCASSFGFALIVWVSHLIFGFPDLDFVDSLFVGGVTSAVFIVFASVSWLFSFEDKAEAKKWNAEFIPADKLVIVKPPTRLYFDTEFTGLRQGTTLISLGIVSDCGKTFYAEFTDYNKSQVDDWIQENVIAKLQFTDKITASCSSWEEWKSDKGEYTDALEFSLANKDMTEFQCIGETPMIKNRLESWLAQFKDQGRVEIWSDCLAYDWVLFANLFGSAFDIPPYIHYIPFDLATAFKIKGIDPDINREEYAYGKESMEIATPNKHNALWDAIVIKDCCSKLL